MTDEILYEKKKPLPVGEIVAKSYEYAWDNRNALILPVALLLLLDLFGAWLTTSAAGAGAPPDTPLFLSGYLAIAVFLLGTMAFAVGIHRRILLGEARQDLDLFRLDRTLLVYIWTLVKISLALGLICFLLVLPISAVQGVSTAMNGEPPSLDMLLPATWVAIIVDMCFGIRLMLALPGAAAGGVRSIRRSWRMTSGNWWRLIVILSGVALPFQLPSLAMMQAHMGQTSWALIIFNSVLSVISVPIFTAALSLSYEKLAPPKPPEEPHP